MTFAQKYGPWVVISGASEGVGRALARRIAAEGVHCILIARRHAPLDDLARAIEREFGVECVTAAIDLAAPDACARIVSVVGDRAIGLYVSNAGGDPEGAKFLDLPVETWLAQAQRGVATVMRCSHHFGHAMRARGKGGLLFVGSGSCYGGSAFMAAYSGIKAFDLNFAESLWAELLPHAVDVLYMALGATDTPELRRLLSARGLPLVSGVADPADVADVAIARLPHGPVCNWGWMMQRRGRCRHPPPTVAPACWRSARRRRGFSAHDAASPRQSNSSASSGSIRSRMSPSPPTLDAATFPPD